MLLFVYSHITYFNIKKYFCQYNYKIYFKFSIYYIYHSDMLVMLSLSIIIPTFTFEISLNLLLIIFEVVVISFTSVVIFSISFFSLPHLSSYRLYSCGNFPVSSWITWAYLSLSIFFITTWIIVSIDISVVGEAILTFFLYA